MRKDLVPMAVSQTITSTTTTREFPEFANFANAVFYLNVTAMAGGGGTLIVTIQ